MADYFKRSCNQIIKIWEFEARTFVAEFIIFGACVYVRMRLYVCVYVWKNSDLGINSCYMKLALD